MIPAELEAIDPSTGRMRRGFQVCDAAYIGVVKRVRDRRLPSDPIALALARAVLVRLVGNSRFRTNAARLGHALRIARLPLDVALQEINSLATAVQLESRPAS